MLTTPIISVGVRSQQTVLPSSETSCTAQRSLLSVNTHHPLSHSCTPYPIPDASTPWIMYHRLDALLFRRHNRFQMFLCPMRSTTWRQDTSPAAIKSRGWVSPPRRHRSQLRHSQPVQYKVAARLPGLWFPYRLFAFVILSLFVTLPSCTSMPPRSWSFTFCVFCPIVFISLLFLHLHVLC